jgi:hypothetical protein
VTEHVRAEVRNAGPKLEPVEEPANRCPGERSAVSIREDRCVVIKRAEPNVKDVVVLSVACFAVMSRAEPELAATLLLAGVGLGSISAGFAGVTESQRRRRKAKLGTFLERATELARDCDNEFMSFDDAKKKCEILQNEEDAFVREQFGTADLALLNNSEGVFIHASARATTPERNALANWCRYRAARLTEMIGRL